MDVLFCNSISSILKVIQFLCVAASFYIITIFKVYHFYKLCGGILNNPAHKNRQFCGYPVDSGGNSSAKNCSDVGTDDTVENERELFI